jgi:NitT/TauT family transport system permease protein
MSSDQPESGREPRLNQPADSAGSARPATREPEAPRARVRWFELRRPISTISAVWLGLACIGVCLALWWFLTRGEKGAERIVSPVSLPSPSETFSEFKSLWTERKLVENTWVTLRRLVLGFGLAALIGVPLGILAGCFPPLRAFLTPLILFGRNIPIAALIPLTFFFFGIDETQKIVFIFLACVAFVVSDAATSILSISQSYVDTAYTLGAKRRHIIAKVLVPLAMPAIFDSLRLLFGLAFGYIMLAETVKLAGEEGGLGNLILMSQRRNLLPDIYLIILIIPIVALAIDRLLYFVQRQLFPHRYQSLGLLRSVVRFVGEGWQALKAHVLGSDPEIRQIVAGQLAAISSGATAQRQQHLSDEDKKRWRP